MSELFDEVGKPVWLPVDFDPLDVLDATVIEATELNGVKSHTSILVTMSSGMQIEKNFKSDEYPAAMDSWRWIKNIIEAAEVEDVMEDQMEITFTPEK